MSKTWFGAIGAAVGAVIGSAIGEMILSEYPWLFGGLGAAIGVYVGYWLFDRKHPTAPQ